MFLTPNNIKYAKCPHCKVTLNSLNWIPVTAFAGNYQGADCPICHKTIEVTVEVIFTVKIEKGENE